MDELALIMKIYPVQLCACLFPEKLNSGNTESKFLQMSFIERFRNSK